jgi:hypothetical protein
MSAAFVDITSGFLSGDTLNFTNESGITVNYNPATGDTILSGTASVATYQAMLRSITYSFNPASGDPTNGGADTSRTISWTLYDGAVDSLTATSTLNTVDLDPTVTANGTATFTGGGSPVALDGALKVTDASSATLASATVSIGSGFVVGGDTLNFTNQNGIVGSYNSATGVLTLSGTASLANYQAALESVTYGFTPANGNPTRNGPFGRTIDWTINDGTTSSSTATSTLRTVHVPATVTAGGSATFSGGSSAVALDAGVTVTDPDSDGALEVAFVEITNGFLPGDTLNFTNQNGITGIYDSADGSLLLSGIASLAAYQAALRSVTYSFSPGNGDPTNGGSDTSRSISWFVDDASSFSNTASSTLTTVHAAPSVTAGATATFHGGGPAAALDPALVVNALDSGGELASASVSITAGLAAGDTLNFTNQKGITGSYNSTTGVLTLSGTASAAAYQAALQSVTYSYSPANGDPTLAGSDTTRTIDWKVGDSVSQSSDAFSTLDTARTPPAVSAGATLKYRPGDAPMPLDAALTVSDPDSGGTLASATVQITGGAFAGDGDVLAASTAGTNIQASYNSATETLTLSGTDTLADYQSVLDGVTFASGSDPTNGGADAARTVSWTLNDGNPNNGIGAPATSMVALGNYNATLAQGPGGAADYLEFAGTQLVGSDAAFSSWNIMAEGDFNHGGRADLVSQNPATGQIDLLFVNNGALQGSLLEQGSYWKVVGAGDFDGSGRTAVATQNTTTGQINLLWFNGTQLASSELLGGSYMPVVGAADINGDGKADFVGQLPDGQLDFLFFNGTQLTGSALTPQSYWAIHDVTNFGGPGGSLMTSQDPASGQLDYLKFNGTNISTTDLVQGGFTSLSVVAGGQAAAQLFQI